MTSTHSSIQPTAPTVAAVIFSYNYGQFLRQSIDSVLSQTSRFDQILIIDDGSTDDSRQVIESYGDKVESVFKENSGQLGAAVEALKHLRTAFVYFLDADDYADRDARDTIAQHLAGNPVKIQFQLRCVDNKGSLDSVIPAYRRGYNSAEMINDNEVIGFYTSPPTSGNVFSVKALQALPLEKLVQREPFDGSPMLCMPYLGEVRSVQRIIANYRLHGANYSLQHAPSPEVFQRALDQHAMRWREMKNLAPNATTPEDGTTVIELEAQCLMNPLGGNRVPTGLAYRYGAQVFRSSLTNRMKCMLSLFMLSLVVLPASIGARLILARRSPGERNPTLKRLLRWVLGVQATQRI